MFFIVPEQTGTLYTTFFHPANMEFLSRLLPTAGHHYLPRSLEIFYLFPERIHLHCASLRLFELSMYTYTIICLLYMSTDQHICKSHNRYLNKCNLSLVSRLRCRGSDMLRQGKAPSRKAIQQKCIK